MALGLLGAVGGDADAKRAKHRDKSTTHVKAKSKAKCTGKGKHRKCRKRQSAFSGHGVGKSQLRAEPLERPSGDVWIYAENLAEEVKTNIYKPDGTFDDAALAQLDNIFRCKRTDEVRAVDPHLYEMLSRIQDNFTGKRAVLISGFRFAERDSSRHYHASAMDIRIPDIGLNDLYKYTQGLDAGGMGLGIYPNSQFIHVDFRAPGEPSYRWTDYSGGSSGKHKAKHKQKSRIAKAKRPTS